MNTNSPRRFPFFASRACFVRSQPNSCLQPRNKFLTPKALHAKAQGQRRSRATLGTGRKIRIYPEGVRPKLICSVFCGQGEIG